ncbi:unnamed protein product [Sphenostylis stenocarpa]|uniref:Uncharacterized protein n=1 Tax=Sphenostylis stenocarpa TaxID=92480 RepID=A0AA86TH43_9FABA|nr:unnamed protein product [Sphenostylis stenocarpa]
MIMEWGQLVADGAALSHWKMTTEKRLVSFGMVSVRKLSLLGWRRNFQLLVSMKGGSGTEMSGVEPKSESQLSNPSPSGRLVLGPCPAEEHRLTNVVKLGKVDRYKSRQIEKKSWWRDGG